MSRWAVNLEAVFSGVAGARNDNLDVAQFALGEPVGFDVVEPQLSQGLKDQAGSGTLNCEL